MFIFSQSFKCVHFFVERFYSERRTHRLVYIEKNWTLWRSQPFREEGLKIENFSHSLHLLFYFSRLEFLSWARSTKLTKGNEEIERDNITSHGILTYFVLFAHFLNRRMTFRCRTLFVWSLQSVLFCFTLCIRSNALKVSPNVD